MLHDSNINNNQGEQIKYKPNNPRYYIANKLIYNIKFAKELNYNIKFPSIYLESIGIL